MGVQKHIVGRERFPTVDLEVQQHEIRTERTESVLFNEALSCTRGDRRVYFLERETVIRL